MAAKKDAPEGVDVRVSEGVATVTVNGVSAVLSKDAVHNLRRQIDAAFIELH